ncbi:MAG: DUF1232 domain-containing protein [Actinomycetota bacterium]
MAAAKALRWGALRSLATAFRTATRPGTASMGTRLIALPRLVWATFRGKYAGTSRGHLLAILGALVYVVSPIDLVPELVLPLIGLGDDAIVIGWIAASLINETESFLHWERERDLSAHGDVIVGDVIQ